MLASTARLIGGLDLTDLIWRGASSALELTPHPTDTMDPTDAMDPTDTMDPADTMADADTDSGADADVVLSGRVTDLDGNPLMARLQMCLESCSFAEPALSSGRADGGDDGAFASARAFFACASRRFACAYLKRCSASTAVSRTT